MFIDIVEIWFGIAHWQILSIFMPGNKNCIICIRSITDTVLDIFMKLHTNESTERSAEHMNSNSGLSSFGVNALRTFNLAIFTMYLCPLCKMKTIWDVFMKFSQM